MNELFLIWRNSREDESDFLGRVRVYKLDDVRFDRFEDRLSYAKYWRSEHDRLEEIIKGALSEVSDFDYKRFRLMDQFATNIGDILGLFSDTVRPRSFEEFLKYGFEEGSPTGRALPLPPYNGEPLFSAPVPPPPTRLVEKGAGEAPPVREPPPKTGEDPQSPLLPPPTKHGAAKWPMALAALVVLALGAVGGYLALNKSKPAPEPSPLPQLSTDEAWCYQEHQKTGLYFVACHKQQADCAKARGDNNPVPGTGCELVDLSKAQWSPAQGVYSVSISDGEHSLPQTFSADCRDCASVGEHSSIFGLHSICRVRSTTGCVAGGRTHKTELECTGT